MIPGRMLLVGGHLDGTERCYEPSSILREIDVLCRVRVLGSVAYDPVGVVARGAAVDVLPSSQHRVVRIGYVYGWQDDAGGGGRLVYVHPDLRIARGVRS